MTAACPPSAELVGLIDGELSENRAEQLRRHVAECAHCRDEISRSEQLIRALAVPAAARAGAAARTHARLQLAMAAPERRPARRSAVAVAAVAGALAAAMLLGVAVRGHGGTDPGELTARGGAEHSLARDVDVEVYASGAALDRLQDGARVSAETPYAISYRNLGAPAFALVFAVDSARVIHWIAPAYLSARDDPPAIALPRGATEVVLPRATLLDSPARGALRIVTLITPHALRVSDIERLAPGATNAASLQRRWPDADVRVLTLELGPP